MPAPLKRKMFRRTADQKRRWSRMANAAKVRKRMENPTADQEPRMTPWYRFSITVADKITGDKHTFDLRSVRDINRRLSVLLRYTT